MFNFFLIKKRIDFLCCCRALDKNEYNHITATYFLLAERRLKIARQEQTPSLTASSSGKSSPKKGSGDVIDGPSEIAACNLLAPPATYYNSSRTGIDGLTTSVSLKFKPKKDLQNSIDFI